MQSTDFMRYKTIKRRLSHIKISEYGFSTNDKSLVAEYACALAWQFNPAVVYLEELTEIIKKGESLPSSHPLVAKVLLEGRAHNSGLIAVCQMVRDLNLSFIRQNTDVFVFAMTDKELRIVEDQLGLDPDTLQFEIPTREEINKGVFRDFYRFYHVEGMFCTKYERLS